MNIITALIILVIGFFLLIKGADFFVEGSSSVAKLLRVPSIIIGLTIVAMGTSLPECAVSVTASLSGNNALAVSNVIGSNIFNLLVVCGFCALFTPLAVQKDTIKRDIPFSLICTFVMLILGWIGMSLGHLDGVIFLVIFAGFIIMMVRSALNARSEAQDGDEIEVLPVWKCIVYIIGGAIAIKYGGDFVVDGASFIASAMGLSQNLIGLTIVALGTSLPELVTSIVAARKNEVDMALGNVIGSNIFNILLVLGIAAAISPVGFLMDNIVDTLILIIMSSAVLVFAWTSKVINRKEGIAMLCMYTVYMVYICIR